MSRQRLYVHLAVPIHFRSRCFHSCDGSSFIFRALTTLTLFGFAAAVPVVPRDKEIADGQEIFRQFLLCSLSFWLVFDHDFRAVEVAERFEEFKSVPTESVPVGDNNLLDIASVDASQKGFKVLPFVVESTTDIFESFVVRITLLEFGDLSLEVTGLFG